MLYRTLIKFLKRKELCFNIPTYMFTIKSMDFSALSIEVVGTETHSSKNLGLSGKFVTALGTS